eukprot:2035144-Rhodomonas_salina.6
MASAWGSGVRAWRREPRALEPEPPREARVAAQRLGPSRENPTSRPTSSLPTNRTPRPLFRIFFLLRVL